MPEYIEKIDKVSLPVIPLRGLVVFPSVPINFEVQRKCSLTALETAQAGDMYVFLLTQKEISVDSPEFTDLYKVGVVAKIKQTLKTPEGTVRVIAEGLCRGTVSSSLKAGDCMFADVITKTVSLKSNTGIRVEALMDEAISALDSVLEYAPQASGDLMLAARGIKNPGLLADFIASNALVRIEDKQKILEIYEPLKRLEKLAVTLEQEVKLLLAQLSVHKKVKEQLDENQRDYYLREELKVIQDELGMNGDDDPSYYYTKIADAHLPEGVAEKLTKDAARLAKTPFGTPEAAVIKNYLDTCLELPWVKKSPEFINIDTAKRILERDHYGLAKPKERILEYLAVKKLAPELKSQILCFVGPPGVGKTSLGASIARAMKREYVRVSLGGIRDEADIRGHRKTYIGSMPGRIISSLQNCGTRNPVMLLDEIDKLCSDAHGDPSSAMLEVLDPEQNKNFRDHFIEMPFDLSDCFFIATANTLDSVPRPLLDRMEIIELHTYTKNEKLNIAKNHLIPKQLKNHGLTKRNLKITDDALSDIIAGYTSEAGVRNLERSIATVCRKIAKKIVGGEMKSVVLTKENLSDYLGARKIPDEKAGKVDLVGVVNGLAYTEVGGDILKIESAVMDGAGKLELTGSLGDVIKESAHIAHSYVRAHLSEFAVPSENAEFYKTRDIHIHMPEGAVPKDGPSAGVTMVTSLVSALTKVPVRCDTAMTGEVTLTGRVLPIGGLREKTAAASSAGVTRVLIPHDNLPDLEEIDSEVRASLTFIPCRTVTEVLREALSSDAYLKSASEMLSQVTAVRIPAAVIPKKVIPHTPALPEVPSNPV